MNHLAHIFLSGDDEYIKIGNFIGDYIKGKKYRKYDPQIQTGIIMHRNIDDFTDKNPIPKKVKHLFSPYFHKYAGIVIDLFYDHFLAVNWDKFSGQPLKDFVQEFYDILERNNELLPDQVQSFLPRMIEQNRLYTYKNLQGMEQALKVMSRRTSLPDNTSKAIKTLSENYLTINNNFLEFFPTIIDFIKNKYSVDIQRKIS